MTSSNIEYRWGVRRRTIAEWRGLMRLSGGIWIVNAIQAPLAYGFGRTEMPHPTLFLLNALIALGVGAVMICCAWLVSDSAIVSAAEGVTIALFIHGATATSFSMYCGGIHFSAPNLLAFDLMAILAFYLLQRSVAALVCLMATTGYALVLLAFNTRGGEWTDLSFLAVNLLVTGLLAGGFFKLIDRERVAKEEARALLAEVNGSLEQRVTDQVEEIRTSRARIVEASDESRRRIERNIHDGAQQQLVAISLELRMIAADAQRLPPEELKVQLDGAHANLKAALDDLRELARGLHPAVLTTDGLEGALGQLAARAPIPVSLVASDERFPEHVETAAYFVAAEAVANIVKYAAASAIDIRVTNSDGVLQIAVSDDGRGGASPSPGGGLAGLRDRVAAVGGELSITSVPGSGTTVAARLPLLDSSRDLGAITPPHRQQAG